MKVQKIVAQTIQKVTPNMHSSRRLALYSCVSSILGGSTNSVTSIGRGISGAAFEKHRIKRADRLCSNQLLHSESLLIYQQIVAHFGSSSATPIILVDWSDLDDRQDKFLLRASLAVDGRALTLYQEVHTIKTKDKPGTHLTFLKRLKSMFPATTQPIVVTDAGFRCPWFQQVRELGWDFVGRVRNRTQYQLSEETRWTPVKELYKKATQSPKLIGAAVLAKANPTAANLVIYKKKPKGRHCYTRKGKVAQWTNSKLTAKREKEPWLLATSLKLTSTLAKRVVKIYQSRMQIELAFRDTKSPQYGIGFSVNRTKKLERLIILILLSAITSLVLMIIGLIAEEHSLQKQFQANTETKRRVLSLHFLGLRIYQESTIILKNCSWQATKQRLEKYTLTFEEGAFS
jgi:hypothetical protein